MSWNEPGERDDKNKKKDPWSKQDEQGPPNLDEALRQLQQKLRSLFNGGKERPPSSGMKMRPTLNSANKTMGIWIVGGVLLFAFLLGGIYVVDPAEEAVILRFGRYVRTELPGPHWIPPFIETKEVINVQEVKTTKHGGQMLTKDENIVSAEIAVQYRINNARDYLFNIVQAERSLQQVSESALRAVVGQSSLNEVLTSGRSEIGSEIRKQVQQNLDTYQAGLEISDLAMQQTKAPEEVKAAFDDAIKAQQDEERLVNESQAYSRKIIPIAEGQAKRTFEESRAYKEQVILNAHGKTEKFAQVLPEYQRAPQVTRERMYLDTLQAVYGNTAKVVVDTNGSNNVMYLPLDKLMQKGQSNAKPLKEEDFSGQDRSNQTNTPVRTFAGRPSYDEDTDRPIQSVNQQEGAQ